MTDKKEKGWQEHITNVNSVYAVWGGERSSEQYYPNWVYEDSTTWTDSEKIVTTTSSSKAPVLNKSSEPAKSADDDYVLKVIEELKQFLGAASEPEIGVQGKPEETPPAILPGSIPCRAVFGLGGEDSKVVNGELFPVSRIENVVGFQLRTKKVLDIQYDDMTEPP